MRRRLEASLGLGVRRREAADALLTTWRAFGADANFGCGSLPLGRVAATVAAPYRSVIPTTVVDDPSQNDRNQIS
jgi:hypothetical protein